MQSTISAPIGFSGIGLHTGRAARIVLHPAPAGHGIVFRRMDVAARTATVPARWDRVIVSPLNTRVENDAGVGVSTVEHLMAALAGCGVHNVRVEVDGPELPILDGSAAVFVRGLLTTGLVRQDAPLQVIEILAPVAHVSGSASARLLPSAMPAMDFSIRFPDAAIGAQRLRLDLGNGAFVRELCDSRTFCRKADIDDMRRRGLALGGTYDNAVVVDGARVLSPGGLRHPDEAVRHKMLDAVGDLAMAGAPILGRYVGDRAGHAVTNGLLRALFARPDAWRMRPCDPALAARLPGVGVARRDLACVA